LLETLPATGKGGALQKLPSRNLCKARPGNPGKFSPYDFSSPEETLRSVKASPLRQHRRVSGDPLTALAFHTNAGIWQSSPSFSPVTRVPGGRGAGLCDGVVPRRPRPGKEAAAGQKSSALLSVWVLLSLLPVFAWEAAGTGTGMHDKEGSGGGSEELDGWSWCSFPKSSPENTWKSVTSWLERKCCSPVPLKSYKALI